MKKIAALFLAVLLAALSAGCSDDPSEPGVVARVNGRAITLAQLEFMSDLMHINQQTDYTPSLEQLREQHGQALADLIVQQLVEQELEKRGHGVTKEEMDAAEETVRADYPEGAFEELLVEEYIDINAWRAQLKARLATEKLANLVLRPRIKLDYQDAEKFYKDHVQDFYLPPRLSLVLVTGPGKEQVDRAVDAFLKGDQPEQIAERLSTVNVRRVKLREDRLPSAWRDALKSLGKDGVSPLWTDKTGVSRIILLEHIPGKLLDPSQAYPLVERILLETRMAEEFEAWLADAVGKADIKVNVHLLREPQEDGAEQAGDADRAVGVKGAGARGADEAAEEGGASGDAAGAASGNGLEDESAGKVRPPASVKGSAGVPTPDLGKAEEPRLTPDLAPQDVAPREIIEQEKGRYYPSEESEEAPPKASRRGKRDTN